MRPDDTVPDGAALIPIHTREGSPRVHAIVDATDADWAMRYRWYLNHNGYAVRREGADGHLRGMRMHREILGLVRGDERDGDHIDGDRLNNRRENLRAVPKGANAQNQRAQRNSSSAYRGVTWNAERNKWQAQVKTKGRNYNLGLFLSEDEAAEAARASRAQLLPYSVDGVRNDQP